MKETLTKRKLIDRIYQNLPEDSNIEKNDIFKIITARDKAVKEALEENMTVKLPYCKMEVRKRRVNSNMSDIDFTYKISTEIDREFRDRLIKNELSQISTNEE